MKIRSIRSMFERLLDQRTRVRALEEEVKEHRRSTALLRALDGAAAAMADELTEHEIYCVLGEQLESLGFRTSILHHDSERDTMRLAYISDSSKTLDTAEALSGLSRTIELPASLTEFHRSILRQRTTEYSHDVAGLARAVLPPTARPFARPIVMLLRLRQIIGAPLVVGDRVVGLMTVSSAELARGDTTAVSVFAHQVSAALRKVQLVGELRESLADLESAEEQLVESQKMHAVGRLAGGVAHDLNNRLTSISVSCEVLRADADEEGTATVELASIAHATAGAAALIRQLLAFSRKQVLDRKPQNLNDVVVGMGRLLERVIGADVTVELELARDLRLARLDRTQVEQVVLNLAVNARDAMKRGGRLTITTTSAHTDELDLTDEETARGELVGLSISDTGCGMSPEVRAQVFDPFFTTKPAGQGTGLGLSVVYGIVRQHGGIVRIYTEPGRGTTVRVLFPTTDAPREPLPLASRPVDLSLAPSNGGQRIMLVEDDEGVRRALERVLRRKGYDVVSVGTVFDALELFDAEGDTFQLLLSDVVLPDGLGPELAEDLTARRPELGVVLATGYTDAEARSEVARDQRWTLLKKPFELDALLDAVSAALADSPNGLGKKQTGGPVSSR